MSYLRNHLKKNKQLHTLFFFLKRGFGALRPRVTFFQKLAAWRRFSREYHRYERMNMNNNIALSARDIFPCLSDNIGATPLDYTYFYQDTWCAKKVFQNKPPHHYDFGSKVEMVGIISQFTPTTMIDIRPVDVELPGLSFKTADIVKTGFPDNSITSLSSICVLEHIGLGRYGDALDPLGTEKAIAEIKRILAPDGNLYISVPIDRENRVYFNAHRAFTRGYVLELFGPLKLAEEKYIYGNRMQDSYDRTKGFGTGLFHFKKS